MEIKVIRSVFTEISTISDYFIDGKLQGYFLEDKDRGLAKSWPITDILRAKIHGKTAIPYGRYEVALTFSNRFQQMMPLLVDVPGFSGVRIHWGNTAEHSEGCLLTGQIKGKDFVGNSKLEYAELLRDITAALKLEKVFIDITKNGL